MSDAMSHAYKQEKLWNKAKEYMLIYFGYEEGNISKEQIKEWCNKYGWTPKELANELNIDIKNN